MKPVQRHYSFLARSGLYDLACGIGLMGRRSRLRRRMVRALRLDRGSRVLEIGCGTGLNLPLLSEAVSPAGRVVAVDLTPEMLARARRRVREGGLSNVTLLNGDAASLPFGDGSFDGVLGSLSLTVIDDPERALAECRRLLRPGGWFCFMDQRRHPRDPILGGALRALSWLLARADVERDLAGAVRRIHPRAEVTHHLGGTVFMVSGRTPSPPAPAEPEATAPAAAEALPPGGRAALSLPPSGLIALRNLLADPKRLVVSVASMVLSVVLIGFQLAVWAGVSGQITTYIENTGAQIWVVQGGATDLFSTSIVPQELETEVAQVPGVDRAAGIYAVYTSINVNDVHAGAYLIGYDTATGLGGPWNLVLAPARPLADDEVIADRHFVSRTGLRPGDRFPLLDREFRLAGISAETSALGCQYLFLRREAVDRLWPEGSPIFTHILVWLRDAAEKEAVAAEIARLAPGIRPLHAEAFARNTRDYVGAFILPLVICAALLGIVVGLAIPGFMLYTMTVDRIEEFALLKALGAGRRVVAGVVLIQASIIAAAGCAFGLPACHALIAVANRFVLGLSAVLEPASASLVVLALAAIAVLASLLPIRRVLRVDPASVFRV
jgi:putative ABC transport system permease protein